MKRFVCIEWGLICNSLLEANTSKQKQIKILLV